MGGGRIQLSAIGKENNYLTINPQISLFKTVYKNYSNFAMQSIRLNFDTIDTLSYDKDTKIKVKLEKNADLINTMFFEIKLPTIIEDTSKSYKFYWIDNLGSALVKSARILIGGEVIEEYDSNYMYIYHNNYINNEKKKIYDNLAGNNINTKNRNYENLPIVINNRLRIPLPFWFHRNIGLSLPVFALEYSDAIVELVLRPIKELCMFTKRNPEQEIPFVPAISSSNNTITLSQSIYHNQLTICDDIIDITSTTIMQYFENNRWDLEPTLDINYIFLEESDKKLFKNSNLQYLVEPINKTVLDNVSGEMIYRIQLQHQVKELYIVPQRTDVNKRNKWLNFTNFDDENEENYKDYQNNFYRIASIEAKKESASISTIALQCLGALTTDSNITDLKLDSSEWDGITGSNSVYIEGKNCYQKQDIENFMNIWKYRPYKDIPYIGQDSYNFFTGNIIENIDIFFDQLERVPKRESKYYSLMQPYIAGLSNNANEVLLYSFSLEPYNYQPSGKCNFSHIKNVLLNIKLKENSTLPIDKYKYDYDTYGYNLNIYAKYYNILEIRSGMAQLLFRN